MVAPIVARNITQTTPMDYYRKQVGFRQRRPIDRNLAYDFEQVTTIQRFGGEVSTWQDVIQWSYAGGDTARINAGNRAKILAYNRFIGMMGDRAQWGINLAEMQQALYMMENRLLQLLQFLRYLRRGDIAGAAGVLKAAIPALAPRNKKRQLSLPEVYLEFHFGWAPLVNDIYASVDVLQNPIPDVTAMGRGKEEYRYDSGNAPFSFRRIGQYTARAQYKAMFAVTNPNLYLANQLGLVNPANVVWELIPYSFVVDWFVNVSQFMNLGTDLLGLTLKYPCTTEFHQGGAYGYWTHLSNPSKGKICAHWWMQRSASISGPSLGVRPMRLWHWRRVAAAASLTAMQLGKLRGLHVPL